MISLGFSAGHLIFSTFLGVYVLFAFNSDVNPLTPDKNCVEASQQLIPQFLRRILI